MTAPRSLRNLFRSSRRQTRAVGRSVRPSNRLRLDSLEDRVTPSLDFTARVEAHASFGGTAIIEGHGSLTTGEVAGNSIGFTLPYTEASAWAATGAAGDGLLRVKSRGMQPENVSQVGAYGFGQALAYWRDIAYIPLSSQYPVLRLNFSVDADLSAERFDEPDRINWFSDNYAEVGVSTTTNPVHFNPFPTTDDRYFGFQYAAVVYQGSQVQYRRVAQGFTANAGLWFPWDSYTAVTNTSQTDASFRGHFHIDTPYDPALGGYGWGVTLSARSFGRDGQAETDASHTMSLESVTLPDGTPVPVTFFSGLQFGNTAPTNITLSHAEVAENLSVGAHVGTLSATDPDTGNTFTYALVPGPGDTDNARFQIVGDQFRTAQAFNYEAGSSYSVRVRVTDSGGLTFEKALTIQVTNVNEAPTADAGSALSAGEGRPVALDGTGSSDVDGDSLTYAWDFGDGTTGSGARPSHVYPDNGTYTATLTVTDPSGATGTDTVTVSVVNAAPTPAINGVAGMFVEGSPVAVTGSATDPAGSRDTVYLTWAVYKDGAATPAFTGSGADWAFTPADNGEYKVVLRADDEDGGWGETDRTVTVGNAAPSLTPVTAPTDPIPAASPAPVHVRSTITDAGQDDSFIAVWDWGDNSTWSTGVAGPFTVVADHYYSSPGVYTITLTVTDDDGASATATSEYVVVYDPSAGFVTGAGWIDSPAGALVANPTATGRARFGFQSRYQHGASVPSGNTQFSFQAGGFEFRSTSYDWLVVSGPKAQYKGSGTVNGTGDYAFKLSVVDGQRNGGGGVDKLRLKVWDKATGLLVYDNQLGAADTADPTTAITSGSIQIHDNGH